MCVTLRLPRRAILLDKSSGDRRSNYLAGGDMNFVGLAEAQAGEELAKSPGEADEPHRDEDMTDLLGFLGGSGAT